MIEYRRYGRALDLLRPTLGRWVATVDGAEVCEVEVSAEIIDTWGRLCALDVAHLLPDGCDPVVRQWLETGDEALREAALAAAWDAWAAADAAAWAAARVHADATAAAAWDAWAAAAWAATAAAARDAARAAARAAAWGGAEDTQRAHLHRLIWEAHGETLTTRERIELARDLRYRGEEAAAAVLPSELREVVT